VRVDIVRTALLVAGEREGHPSLRQAGTVSGRCAVGSTQLCVVTLRAGNVSFVTQPHGSP